MKKFIFALGLFALLAGCGGGGSDSTVLASLQVTLSGSSGGPTTGHSIHVEGPGVSYTCHQSPTTDNPNDPRCQLAAAGTGNTETPLIFNNLPTGATYTFTEVAVNGVVTATGSCPVTIIDSTHTDPASGSTCTLGDVQSQQLNLTIALH